MPDRQAAGALLDLLEKENEAIRAARFDVVERLETEKARLSKALQDSTPSGAELAELRGAAARNGRLLRAMADGVARARNRLAAVTHPPALTVYDPGGRLVTTGGAGPTISRSS
jgi:flagellar biosynthesis/type III secretory pathway chaperone